jgi:hypothetical protein
MLDKESSCPQVETDSKIPMLFDIPEGVWTPLESSLAPFGNLEPYSQRILEGILL